MSVFANRRLLVLGIAALLTGLAGQVLAVTHHRHLTIVNRSGETITEFHASSIWHNAMEEDILGLAVLSPGYSVSIDLRDEIGDCRFDLKTVTDKGHVITRHDVNVCDIPNHTLRIEGMHLS